MLCPEVARYLFQVERFWTYSRSRARKSHQQSHWCSGVGTLSPTWTSPGYGTVDRFLPLPPKPGSCLFTAAIHMGMLEQWRHSDLLKKVTMARPAAGWELEATTTQPDYHLPTHTCTHTLTCTPKPSHSLLVASCRVSLGGGRSISMVLGCLAFGGLSFGSTFSSPSAGAGLFLSPPSLLGGGVWDELGSTSDAGISFKLGCVCMHGA